MEQVVVPNEIVTMRAQVDNYNNLGYANAW